MIILKPFWFFLTDKFVSSLLPNHSDVSISKKDVSNRFRLSEEEITYVVLLMYHNDYGGGSLSCFATLKSLLHSLKLMRLTRCIQLQLVITLIVFIFSHLVCTGVLTTRDVDSWWLSIPGAGVFMKNFSNGKYVIVSSNLASFLAQA